MAFFQVVFRTQGTATSFVNTTNSLPIFLTGGQATRFLSTFSPTPFFQTGSVAQSFVTTKANSAPFLSASQSVSFFITPDTGTTKLLKLKIGDLTFNSNQTNVEFPDATGEYDATTNPGGYNPEATPPPPVAGRPKRSEVYLWTAYRIWNRYGNTTQTPDSQPDEADPSYTYTLTFPTEEVDGEAVTIKGIYEIAMMAVPNTLSYSNYIGDSNLITMAEEFPDWYVTSVGVMVDADVVNCLSRMRYEYLQSVMCGKCDDEYLAVYSIYVGMLNAMEVGEWSRAVEFYEKLKTICTEQKGPSCGC